MIGQNRRGWRKIKGTVSFLRGACFKTHSMQDGEEHSQDLSFLLWFPSGSPSTWGRQFELPAQFGRHFFKFNNYLFCCRFRQKGMFTVRVRELTLGKWVVREQLHAWRTCEHRLKLFVDTLFVLSKTLHSFTAVPREWSQTVNRWKEGLGGGCISGRLIKHHSGSPMRSLTCWSLVSFTELIAGMGLFLLQWQRSVEYAGREREMLKSRDEGAPFGRRGEWQLPKKRRNEP